MSDYIDPIAFIHTPYYGTADTAPSGEPWPPNMCRCIDPFSIRVCFNFEVDESGLCVHCMKSGHHLGTGGFGVHPRRTVRHVEEGL